jgi:hypothetical protein
MPLCKSEKPLLRCLGVLLLNVIAAFYILLIMSICVSVF